MFRLQLFFLDHSRTPFLRIPMTGSHSSSEVCIQDYSKLKQTALLCRPVTHSKLACRLLDSFHGSSQLILSRSPQRHSHFHFARRNICRTCHRSILHRLPLQCHRMFRHLHIHLVFRRALFCSILLVYQFPVGWPLRILCYILPTSERVMMQKQCRQIRDYVLGKSHCH